MKTIGNYRFPETCDEANAWEPATRWRALNRDVLAVATTRVEGTWKAYCAAVPGYNHDDEWQAVLDQGCPMTDAVAKVLFPEFDGIPYAR